MLVESRVGEIFLTWFHCSCKGRREIIWQWRQITLPDSLLDYTTNSTVLFDPSRRTKQPYSDKPLLPYRTDNTLLKCERIVHMPEFPISTMQTLWPFLSGQDKIISIVLIWHKLSGLNTLPPVLYQRKCVYLIFRRKGNCKNPLKAWFHY